MNAIARAATAQAPRRHLGAPAVPAAAARVAVPVGQQPALDADDVNEGGWITVRKDATLEGDVDAEGIVVAGRVRGRLRATAVRVLATGRLEGEVAYRSLTIEPGGLVEARCERIA